TACSKDTDSPPPRDGTNLSQSGVASKVCTMRLGTFETLFNVNLAASLGQWEDLQPSYLPLPADTPTIVSCCGCVWKCPCQCHPRTAPEPFPADAYLQYFEGPASYPQLNAFPAPVIPTLTPPTPGPVPSVDSSALFAPSIPAANVDAEQLDGVSETPYAGPEVVPQTFRIAPGVLRRFGLKGPPDYIDFSRPNCYRKGVLLSDMQIKEFSDLAQADEVVLENHGCQIVLQINWPGYKGWSKPLRTRVQRQRRNVAASRGVIAHRVALCVQQFIKDQENEQRPEQWVVGRGAIGLNNILLLRLVQVTQGGWRAEFAVT
ncbi:hypothetical protein EVG20_g8376, partial [Dentipellis fragilis]